VSVALKDKHFRLNVTVVGVHGGAKWTRYGKARATTVYTGVQAPRGRGDIGGWRVGVDVARRHDLNANLLFNWRQSYRQGLLVGAFETTTFAPIRVATVKHERLVPTCTAGAAEFEAVLAA